MRAPGVDRPHRRRINLMSRKGRGLPVKQLRRGLLMALFAFLGVVLALYVLGRMGKPEDSNAVEELNEDSEGELVLSGKGFDYGLTQKGREVLHVSAGRVISDRDDNYELEDVVLTMTRENGDVFELESDRGFYNVESQQASFEGNVRFTGPQGIELTTDGLELRDEGDLLVSSSSVEFKFLGRYFGQAKRLRISPQRNLFVLAGQVEVDSIRGESEPMSLRCRRFAFDRDTKVLRAEGAVELSRGGDTLRARRLAVHLTEDEKQVQTVVARWDVRGGVMRPTNDGQISRAEFKGRELKIQFKEGTEDPEKAELLAGGDERARLSMIDETGLTRRIDALSLKADFEDGTLRVARAFDDVEIVEHLTFSPDIVLRTVCSDTLVANVSDGGELQDIEIEGLVQLHQGEVQGFGDRARANLASGEMEVVGRPAWFFRGSDELRAPRIIYDQEADKIVAQEEVQAVVFRGSGFDASGNLEPSDVGDEPIRIVSKEAIWTRNPSIVTFEGDVRAWQGENFMQANKMVGEEDTSRLIASGRVKTVVRPGEKKAEEEGAPNGDLEMPREPLEVTSDEMVYDRVENLIVFSGNARALQAKRTLQCEEIHLRLAEEGGFEQMSCEGSTRINDAENGNTVSGDRALYLPKTRQIQVFGSPVVLRDSKGTTLQGRVLVYDVESGRARMQTESPTPTSSDNSQ